MGPADGRTIPSTRRGSRPSLARMRRSLLVILLVPLLTLAAAPASADPGGPFRRTTPRGLLDQDPGGGLDIGIPAGRAWGVESGLRLFDASAGASRVTFDLAVGDPDVAEAFVRVAYYARGDQRSRQLATVDSPFVRVGPGRRVTVELDRPAGAVAYRVRVLGRLVAGAAISRADAIRARWAAGPANQGPRRPSPTRLLTDLP